ncbi:MAG: DUF512 domain-containing protein [Acidimicrobiia bacterium]
MSTARVVAVAPESAAARAGIAVGDELLAANAEPLRDVIRYSLAADEPVVELVLRRGGVERTVTIEKAPGEPLGLELDGAVFDRVRTCDNHCPFCFIYQLPKGMRKSLYLKDDDYRLSFLYGNFTTLTRFTEADLERVITEKLDPLYVSIHATDPDVRTTLLRNTRGATSLRWLAALLDAGAEVHGQVVVCPGVNDGAVLEDTLLGVLERFPKLTTLGVVPLGVSDHNTEPDMRACTAAEAQAVLDTIDRWQETYLQLLGRRLVYASDEWYLIAGRPFPSIDAYDGCRQHENGIGMVRTFEAEVLGALAGEEIEGTSPASGFFAWVEGAPAEGYRAPRTVAESNEQPVMLRARRDQPVTILTGEYGARVIEPLLPALRAAARVPVDVLAVPNRYFGGNTAVAGLMTGADLVAALDAAPTGHRYLLPDVCLSNGVFLDGMGPGDLPRPVEVIGTDGVALVSAIV